MGEKGRELYGLERSLDNSLMVVCGGEVVVAAAHNVAAMDDVVATIGAMTTVDVVAIVGATTVVDVKVQQCWMRASTNP